MYFLTDNDTQHTTLYKNNGEACRAALKLLNITTQSGDDPVKILFNHERYGDRVVVRNLSSIMNLIIVLIDAGVPEEAQAVADSIKGALDDHYSAGNRH